MRAREGKGQKGYGGNALEIARVGSVSAEERKAKREEEKGKRTEREKSTKGENRQAASVL